MAELKFVCENCGGTHLVKAVAVREYWDFDLEEGYIEETEIVDSEGVDDWPTFCCESCKVDVFTGSDDEFLEWLTEEGMLIETED